MFPVGSPPAGREQQRSKHCHLSGTLDSDQLLRVAGRRSTISLPQCSAKSVTFRKCLVMLTVVLLMTNMWTPLSHSSSSLSEEGCGNGVNEGAEPEVSNEERGARSSWVT